MQEDLAAILPLLLGRAGARGKGAFIIQFTFK
jgi:hypothetical protein